ncbi:MAG: proline iminopeptidase-family hydrolase [Candidatus Dormibacteria bacterium]
MEGQVDVPGGKVWYQVLGAERPGTPLLCLHGGPGMTHDYLEPLGELSAERPVIFYDQLGSGRSDRPSDPNLWTMERFLDELGAVHQALGLERHFLFGNSWGGWLALQYTLDRRPSLAGLVLSSAPPRVSGWIENTTRLRNQLPEPVRAALDHHQQGGFYTCPEYLGAVSTFYRRHLCRLDPWPDCLERSVQGFGDQVYSTMWGPAEFGPVTGRLRDWDVSGRLEEVAVPTLITGGRYDEASQAELGLLTEGIAGSELAIFDDSSHMAFLEQPQDYLRRLRGFLDQVESSGPVATRGGIVV